MFKTFNSCLHWQHKFSKHALPNQKLFEWLATHSTNFYQYEELNDAFWKNINSRFSSPFWHQEKCIISHGQEVLFTLSIAHYNNIQDREPLWSVKKYWYNKKNRTCEQVAFTVTTLEAEKSHVLDEEVFTSNKYCKFLFASNLRSFMQTQEYHKE
jgi:hypothetical protein